MSQYKILYCDSGLGMLARRQALGEQALVGVRRRGRAGTRRASLLGRAGRQAHWRW